MTEKALAKVGARRCPSDLDQRIEQKAISANRLFRDSEWPAQRLRLASLMGAVVLAVVCMAGPYFLGVAPRTRRQWLSVALTIAFLAWLLLFMTSLRSR
jgi:hypothetical protein